MDEKVEERTAELMRRKYADNSLFHYGRNSDFDFMFTRRHKDTFAPRSAQSPFTDSGSFQSRKYFTRPDYVIQNPINGAMLRGQQPRITKKTSLN
jgi:hypothetical protein